MKLFIGIFISLFFFTSCNDTSYQLDIDLQGHRGCRGILPENSQIGFIKAIDIGVNTLEMDVVISKDSQVVVSHEAYLSTEICKALSGDTLTDEEGKSIRLFDLNYEDIAAFDCGSKPHPRFPTQTKNVSKKPLLSNVLFNCESYIKKNNYPIINYNIETKTAPKTDNILHPEPAKFVALLLKEIENASIQGEVCIQSFDPRTLQIIKKKNLPYQISLLVENEMTIEENIKRLGFKPDVYSPDYIYVNKELVHYCRTNGILLKPWTVNEESAIKKMLELGVDGIITDYPDHAKTIMNQLQQNQ